MSVPSLRVSSLTAALVLALAASRAAAQDPVCFAENFDGVTPPDLPAGWTATNALGPDPLWVTSVAQVDTPPNAAYAEDDLVITDKRLDTPSIPITATGAVLTFRQRYELETGFDGAVLEISIGGGAFQDIKAAGGDFLLGDYSGVISDEFQSPIALRQAWTGHTPSYFTTSVRLPDAAAGQSVVLRFRMATDVSEEKFGWLIDSITLSDACGVVAASIAVDQHAPPPGAPSGAGLNGILEPGESVLVETGVFNGSGAGLAVQGTASSLTGPAGATYVVEDAAADYGFVGAGATADCFTATGDCYEVSVNLTGPRPAAHWDATLHEELSDGGSPDWTLHIGDSFTDVDSGNLFYPFIENIFHNGITGGCGPGAYCPLGDTLRQQMAVFVLKAREGADYAPPACTGTFTDVPCPGPFTDWIEELFNRGVVAGCGPGPTYCPSSPVLRQQMAVFLLRTLLGSSYTPPPCTGMFPDVDCGNPFAAWVEDLVNRGIAAGCGGGNFCPTNVTNRGQMAPFLVKTFGLVLYAP